MNFTDQLNSEYGDEVSSLLATNFGVDVHKSRGLLGQVAPVVLGGLHQQMNDDNDEDTVRSVMDHYADESALGDLAGYFGRNQSREPDPGIAGLLGGQSEAATSALATRLGISSETAGKILPILIPIILGAVMKKMKTGGQSTSGGSRGGGGGGGMDVLGSILGQTGGSNVLGDVAGLILGGGQANASGRGGSDLAQKAGCLMNLLGAFLKAKR